MTRDTQPSPETALQDWLDTASYEKFEETVKNYRVLANHLQSFCEQEGIETVAQLDGRALLQFKVWRSQEVARSTLSQNISCLRAFLRYCQQVEIVEDGLLDKVPEVRASEEARDEKLDADDAAFANLLYFWAKGDTGLVDQCWRASDRYDEKARRSDYRERTIRFAGTNRTTDTFQSKWCG